MSRFIETIRIQDGLPMRLDLHQERLEKAFATVDADAPLELSDLIKVPIGFCKGRVKCRVLYDSGVKSISYHHYSVRQVHHLRLVYDDVIDYHFKYEDRTHLSDLFAKRGDCHDILIVKEGYVTDSYYANVAFLKDGLWYTPKAPLLEGVHRRSLLQYGQVQLADIRPADLSSYKKCRLFNAMIDFGEIELDVSAIHS